MKPTIIWIIDDDKNDTGYMMKALLDMGLPDGSRIDNFEDLYSTRDKTYGPNILIIDISAICPIAAGYHGAYGPICSFHQKYPSCLIVIASAVSKNFALDVQESVVEKCQEARVEIAEWTSIGCDENVVNIIRKELGL